MYPAPEAYGAVWRGGKPQQRDATPGGTRGGDASAHSCGRLQWFYHLAHLVSNKKIKTDITIQASSAVYPLTQIATQRI